MWIVKSSGASLPYRTEVDSLLHVMVWSEQIALSKALAIVCSLQSFPGLISSAPATFQTFSTENSYIEPRYLLYKPDRIPHKKPSLPAFTKNIEIKILKNDCSFIVSSIFIGCCDYASELVEVNHHFRFGTMIHPTRPTTMRPALQATYGR